MIRRFCTLAVRHATALNLARGGLRILAVLALALTLLGASPSGSARAAPAYATYHFVMNAVPSAAYVCAGGSMTFKVSISVQLENQPGDTAPNFGRIRGGWVFSNLVSGDGVINPSSNFWTSSEEIAPDSANFSFSAGNTPGTTTVSFESFVSEFWLGAGNYMEEGEPQHVSTTAEIEVRNCGYRIDFFLLEAPGLKTSGGLNCQSPYGPWDLKTVNNNSLMTDVVRIIIPFSKDGKTNAILEHHFANKDIRAGQDMIMVTKVTITPSETGYIIKFKNDRWVGKAWFYPPGQPDEITPFNEDGYYDDILIIPALPGDCQ